MSGRPRFTNSKKENDGTTPTSDDAPKKGSWRDRHQATAAPQRQTSQSTFGYSRDSRGGDSRGAASCYGANDARSGGGGGGGGSNRFSRDAGDYGSRQDSRSGGGFSDRGGGGFSNGGGAFGGGGGGRDRFQRNGNGGGRGGEPPELGPLKKSFYAEHEDVAKMTEEEVTAWRTRFEMKIEGKDIPRPLQTFEHGGFPTRTLQELYSAGFKAPSPIQSQAWPMALSGRDVIGIAQTGSGKTLSFLLPGVVHIMAQPALRNRDGPIGLVLAPTRELANQINEECARFNAGLRVTCVYGGAPKYDQKRDLRRGVEIVIATPGRLMDFIDSRDINMDRVTYLVMDEADRMLDMGFEPQIRAILEHVRTDRQTLMFSATWPRGVERLAHDYMSGDVIKVTIGSENLTANKKITQTVEIIEGLHNKEDRLFEILSDQVQDDKVLIFAGTKRMCNELERTLTHCNVCCSAIHGDKSQHEREAALHDFKTGNTQIMIGTDVAARGIHVDDIAWVINYDFPQQVEDYIHRIGRTGRAGRTGKAISFVSRKDAKHADQLIEILMEANQEVPEDLRRLACNSSGFRRRSTRNGPERSNGDAGRFGSRQSGNGTGGGIQSRFGSRGTSSSAPSGGGQKKKVDRSAW